ncbi:hypothetical protein QNI16_23555 [Cytophagaceae bacterium YF14B1]|uniref:Uncharacterized protein n=1 Tax=Xanthocytophaga flava TaxID=3048013 RepID=A0AAE3QQH6_9BACT|nr:hypothetical protein [Xanthocytophaga flavus]MDJ1483495.1 hypothetical protein [Xanthocytophaga flavus]
MAISFGRKSSGPGPGDKTVSRSFKRNADGSVDVEVSERTSQRPKASYNSAGGKSKAPVKKSIGFGSGSQKSKNTGSASKKVQPGKTTEVKRVFKFEKLPSEPVQGERISTGKKMPLQDKSELVNSGKNKVGKMSASEVARRQVAGEGSTYDIMKKGQSQGRGSAYSVSGKNIDQDSSIEPAESNINKGRTTQGRVRDKYGKKR